MADIKTAAQIRDKWTRVTPGRTEDYKLGIAQPRRNWEQNTAAGAENWKAGIDKAASQGLFARGVTEAGNKKWQEKALKKGPARFSEGVYLAGDDYGKGFEPYRQAIASVDLGPRYPKRDPRNMDRIKRIVDALVQAKTA